MRAEGSARMGGDLGLRVIRADGRSASVTPLSAWPRRALTLAEINRYGMRQRGLPVEVNRWRNANRGNLARGIRRVVPARLFRIPHFYGQLFLTVERSDGELVELGLAGLRMVTTVGVKYITDDMAAGANDINLFKFHGFGTGGGAEAVGNTALTTEVTNTTYVGDVRPTGSQASATVTNDATYTTVATYSPDSGTPIAVTEHGIFSANAVGTLLDKTLFAVVTLATGDSLQATYVLTFVAGQ